MNEKFFELPVDKQQKILNAGFKIFSECPYRKAPVAEIAAEAGISKSLLFYYFKNKKDLYLYLWDEAIRISGRYIRQEHVLETDDLFEMMERSIIAKCEMMTLYPYISAFCIQAYFEQDTEIAGNIQKDFDRQKAYSADLVMNRIDTARLRPDLDARMIYREMIWASDGYIHMSHALGGLESERIKDDFHKLNLFWRQAYGAPDLKEPGKSE